MRILALIGGGEWTEGCEELDAELLHGSRGKEVVVLPTAAAFEQPDRCVEHATEWFARLGATVRAPRVLQRRDALDPANVDVVRGASFIYLAGGSPLHLRSVIKETPLWDALVEAHRDGAVVAGSSAGAMVLGDPMIDPRGGAFTVGLGLVSNLAVLPHAEADVAKHHKRTFELADAGLVLAAIPERNALVRDSTGAWCCPFDGTASVWVDGEQQDFSVLPGLDPV